MEIESRKEETYSSQRMNLVVDLAVFSGDLARSRQETRQLVYISVSSQLPF